MYKSNKFDMTETLTDTVHSLRCGLHCTDMAVTALSIVCFTAKMTTFGFKNRKNGYFLKQILAFYGKLILLTKKQAAARLAKHCVALSCAEGLSCPGPPSRQGSKASQ